ncbi:allergin-1 isoform X2 [Castor canadensis]|uniref:Allergin-1 isoform X2 n=2 Tax=Castor canadensis TaxID=51338 RepID=A0AC58K9E0_CASCN
MWSHLNTLFFGGIFPFVTFLTAAWDCEIMSRRNEFSAPTLSSNTSTASIGQNVSLFCSNKNKTVETIYSLFLHKKHLAKKEGQGKPVIFNIRISKASESGPYKCKAQVSNCSKYSSEFNFTLADGDSCPLCLPMLLIPVLLLMLLATILILIFCIRPKYKARKAMRENRPKSPGDLPMEGELYANICKAGTGHFQEIHYATPVFQEGPREQDTQHPAQRHQAPCKLCLIPQVS